MPKTKRVDKIYDRMIALLSASTRVAVISTDLDNQRVETLNLMVRGFSAEITADGLLGQLKQIEQALQHIKSRLDSSEIEHMRIQETMQRITKQLSTLSNLLKKMSHTAQAITQNIK